MTAVLDSGLSLDSMNTYSPALKSSSVLPHQSSRFPRHDQYEISELAWIFSISLLKFALLEILFYYLRPYFL